ncbi:MAG: lysophospholipase [Amphritea sp.]
MKKWSVKVLIVLFITLLVAGCGPKIQRPGPASEAAYLSSDQFITDDGISLPVRQWEPGEQTSAVVIALHGFNDYSGFITDLADALVQKGIVTYAYDQRGFGAAPHTGIWAGTEVMQRDLRTFTKLIRQRHPQVPLYLLGESMGGALILLTLSQTPELPIDGAILSAPAVWGPSTWPWYQRESLRLGAHLLPWMKVNGKGLDITASDNSTMLRELGRDPLVIKNSRLDSLWGVSQLMEAALQAAPQFRVRSLILIGEKDEIVPLEPSAQMVAALPEEHHDDQQIALYNNGYHMLTRGLQAQQVWQDITAWIKNPNTPLPSGADRGARKRLAELNNRD